jgi:hypothetical protein
MSDTSSFMWRAWLSGRANLRRGNSSACERIWVVWSDGRESFGDLPLFSVTDEAISVPLHSTSLPEHCCSSACASTSGIHARLINILHCSAATGVWLQKSHCGVPQASCAIPDQVSLGLQRQQDGVTPRRVLSEESVVPAPKTMDQDPRRVYLYVCRSNWHDNQSRRLGSKKRRWVMIKRGGVQWVHGGAGSAKATEIMHRPPSFYSAGIRSEIKRDRYEGE